MVCNVAVAHHLSRDGADQPGDQSHTFRRRTRHGQRRHGLSRRFRPSRSKQRSRAGASSSCFSSRRSSASSYRSPRGASSSSSIRSREACTSTSRATSATTAAPALVVAAGARARRPDHRVCDRAPARRRRTHPRRRPLDGRRPDASGQPTRGHPRGARDDRARGRAGPRGPADRPRLRPRRPDDPPGATGRAAAGRDRARRGRHLRRGVVPVPVAAARGGAA